MSIRKPIFDAVRVAMGRGLRPEEVIVIDDLLDTLGVANAGPTKLYKMVKLDAFFDGVRRNTGALDQVQVDTINGLLAAADHWPIGFLAYGLATAWHEAKLRPIEEIGKGRGRPYGAPGKYGQAQYGRGLVQLTWDRNYEWADKALKLQGALLKDFSKALEPGIATAILVKGMETGAFTGKKLGDYMVDRGTHDAFVRCRRIINGTDRDEQIADYADWFQAALDAGGWA